MTKNTHLLSIIALTILCSFCKKNEPSEPSVTLSATNVTLTESNQNQVVDITVTLDAAPESAVKCRFETVDGTAKAGVDYEAKSGDLTFAAGETSKKISITVLGDTEEEQAEYFTVRFSGAEGLLLGRDVVSIELKNDDLFIPTTGYDAATSYPNRTLVWSDEFSGTAVDASAWTFEIGNNNGWGNNELQYYRAENATVKDGFLVIEARNETFGGKNYTSTRMITKGKKEFTYGRMDIRAVLPETQGIWPAIWMLGGNIGQVGWPACGEIDIMELLGHEPDKVYGTVHYGPDFSQHQYIGGNIKLPAGESFAKTFHVFSIDWTPEGIKWYVDDQLYYQFSKANAGSYPYPFDKPQFFLLNIAVGGNWPGAPNNTTILPQQMIVDYVRVYQ